MIFKTVSSGPVGEQLQISLEDGSPSSFGRCKIIKKLSIAYFPESPSHKSENLPEEAPRPGILCVKQAISEWEGQVPSDIQIVPTALAESTVKEKMIQSLFRRRTT